MKSAFGYRFMITDGWGRNLFPPEDPQGEQRDAAGGEAEVPEETQGVRLEEYRGWSRGTWTLVVTGAQEDSGGRRKPRRAQQEQKGDGHPESVNLQRKVSPEE